MKRIGIYTLILYGLFYFSEGKPCPEKTRPHKTRCEAYYRCRELPNKTHVWVPEKCEKGLVYEQNLKMCVLPGDDWECLLGETTITTPKDNRKTKNELSHIIDADQKEIEVNKNKEADIYIISNGNDSIDEDSDELPSKKKMDGGRMEVILDTSLSNEDDEDDPKQYESSGDGELIELDGFLQAENKEGDIDIDEKPEKEEKEIKATSSTTTSLSTISTTSVDSGGSSNSNSGSKIDPNLTAHLQRLSQLIDGLKDTYQNQDKEQAELRPDQLNAFLAHFNIKNKFDSIDPTVASSHIQAVVSSTTAAPIIGESTKLAEAYKNAKNKTVLQEHLSNKLKPETKVVLSNMLPKRYDSAGYSNSQIVVNRPEGSVLFSLPPYNSEQLSSSNFNQYNDHSGEYNSYNSPKISEDTLKTVLELSKQMIATQNIPKVIPNPAYYAQPILQPLYLTAPFPTGTHNNPFSTYYNKNNGESDYDEDDNNNGYSGSHKYHGHNKRPIRPSTGTGYSKPGTTIIHNNVIPVHVTSTSSGEKEVIDSYGQSLGRYPPLNVDDNNANGGFQSQTINHLHQHSHRFQDNKFITSVTTVRPFVSSTPSPNQYELQYPTEITVTTARPATIAEYYTPSPHLNENNVNSLFQSTDRFPTIQYGSIPRPMDLNRPSPTYQDIESSNYAAPSQSSLFPAQIDPNKVKIRPNAHKIESMEVEADEAGTGYDGQLQAQILTYNGDKPFSSSSLSSSYIEPAFSVTSTGNMLKNPYMPRPQTSSPTGFGVSVVNKPKFPNFGSHSSNSYGSTGSETQLVNVGGNFISYDVFQNTILPLMGQGQPSNEMGNVEVITCSAGVRQPNNTDCTRYYVCSKKDGKVLSYSCPPYTAFNPQTRICDARTYSLCSPDAIVSTYTVNENKRIQMEAIKALQEAKRRREQAMKAQNIANLLQQYNTKLQPQSNEEQGESDENSNTLNSYVQQAASLASIASTTARPVKKRKYYCKEGDKIADQTSINSYFVCYKNAQGTMKGHKMTCSKGLLFCPKILMCTLPSKCG